MTEYLIGFLFHLLQKLLISMVSISKPNLDKAQFGHWRHFLKLQLWLVSFVTLLFYQSEPLENGASLPLPSNLLRES